MFRLFYEDKFYQMYTITECMSMCVASVVYIQIVEYQLCVLGMHAGCDLIITYYCIQFTYTQ